MSKEIRKIQRKNKPSKKETKGIFAFYRLHTELTMVVCYMDLRFNGRIFVAEDQYWYGKNQPRQFIPHNNLREVSSASLPELTENTLYLWGSSGSANYKPSKRIFMDPTSCQEYLEKAKELLKRWSLSSIFSTTQRHRSPDKELQIRGLKEAENLRKLDSQKNLWEIFIV